jgi:pimeloyl-ACP methyl ester carboxylesterase
VKNTLALLAFTVAGSAVMASPQPELMGHWSGVWTREGSALAVSVHFQRTASGWEGSFDSDQLRVLGVPLRDISATLPTLSWKIVGDRTTMVFRGRIQGDVLAGEFEENGAHGTFRLERYVPRTSPPAEREITFSSGAATLSGTLVLPNGVSRPVPAVVFLHGSGPEGRWASKYLAVRFAEAGIAALIYDKRGVGKSTGDWSSVGFEELADDAAAAIHALRREAAVDGSRVGIHGHSQGGTLAPLVAQRVPDVAFVIASAAAGLPMETVEIYSLENAVRIGSLSPEEARKAREYIAALVATAYRGQPRERLLAIWEQVRDRPWAFELPEEGSHYWSFSRRIAGFDPDRQWTHVGSPVLLVYGELDQRVPPRASAVRIVKALLEAGGKSVSVHVFEGADHTFRLPDGASASVWPRTAPGYPALLIEWVERITSGAGPPA